MEEVRFHERNIGAHCATVTLNRYEILAAIIRAAIAKAGFGGGFDDFGLDARGWDVPDNLTFELFDGETTIVAYESVDPAETVEQAAARKVRQILNETRKVLVESVDKRLERAKPALVELVESGERAAEELDQEVAYEAAKARGDALCFHCGQFVGETPRSKYCERNPQGMIDGNTPHSYVSVDTTKGRQGFLRRQRPRKL